ncbi:response regulator transcription factor [Paenibacillus cymbidii]|uniref:response regulator transcription factor n=1 Tax=Paenibacillus cymbidii TaxID=1639034 RepID=UPI001080C40D|nr:response regulator [Paenibacillus cymbidii]
MKKTVVVIDDKPLIRQSIVQTIDWESLQCEVVGQAEDGIQGKRTILEKQPDILITDIKMPGLSGLDLAELMNAELPQSKTILITGYQDFADAQRAVRLGVCDYIVKPIRNEELERVIGMAVQQLDEQMTERRHNREIAEAYTNLEQRHRRSLPQLRSQLLAGLIGGSVPHEEEWPSVLRSLGIDCKGFVVMIVRSKLPLGEGAKLEGAGEAVAGDWRSRLTELARASSANREIELIEYAYRNDLVFACLFAKALAPREVRLKMQQFGQSFIEQARREYGFDCRLAISAPYKSLRDAGEAFAEGAALMDIGFFRTEEPILFPEHGQWGAADSGKFSIIRDLEQFNQMLEHATIEEMIAYMEQFLAQIAVYSEGNILVAKGLISEVCLAAARYYFRITGDEFSLGKSIDQILEEVYRLESMRAASDYLAAFIKSIKDKLAGGDKEYSLIVKKVVDYINSHFADNLSLTSVADQFGLSPSYLSRLLRTETGINFVDLVCKARIEVAKRLLKDPKYKVNEVGELVGYREYSYFYQVFKKVEGISPKEFKNKGKEIE